MPSKSDNPKTSLFLFRHGETDWNKMKRWQGQIDVPLNEAGKAQARSLIPVLRDLKLDLLVSSDLRRALETAEVTAKALDLAIITQPLLRELSFGLAEGKTVDEITAQFGIVARDQCRSMLNRDLDFRFPEGESKRQLIERAMAAIRQLIHHHSKAIRMGIATHGGIIRSLIQVTRGEQADPTPVVNGSLFHFEFERDRDRLSFVGQLVPALPTGSV